MVGDVTARAAYASVVLYDDQDGDGTLDLAQPDRLGETAGALPSFSTDLVYGASFIAMTQPDTRVTYREGAFSQASAFYPRAGCGDPPPAFSIDSASGFTAVAAIQATLMGTLPQESDLARCAQLAPGDTTITVPAQSPTIVDLKELACSERSTDSSVRYREASGDAPDLTGRQWACMHAPSFSTPSQAIELVITGHAYDACVGLTHYILKGCREGPDCAAPDWDHSLAPPSWWPC
jgi:hypothetical protein